MRTKQASSLSVILSSTNEVAYPRDLSLRPVALSVSTLMTVIFLVGLVAH